MKNYINRFCEKHKEQEMFISILLIMINTCVASLTVAAVSWHRHYWIMLILSFLAMLSNATFISQRKFTTVVYMFIISVVSQLVLTFLTL